MTTSHRVGRRARRTLPIAALALSVLAAGGAAAQQPHDDADFNWHGYSDPNQPFARSGGHQVVVGGTTASGSATALTRHGAAGTTIPVAIASLPPNVSAQINFGALQDGFEVIETASVDGAGRFAGRDTMTVRIPSWAKNDRPYLLIVSDLQYNALAPAAMVHPTDARGRVERRGVVKRDAGCLTLTGQVGELYYLTGETRVLTSGQEVRVTGRPVEDGRCGIGTTLEVESARIVER